MLYNTRSCQNMDLYVPRVTKGNHKSKYSYMGSDLWNELHIGVKESVRLDSFEQNYKYSGCWIK